MQDGKDNMRKKLVAIDGTSLIYRAFFAIQNEMRNKEGQSTRGTYGFLSMIFKLMEEYKPDYFAVAWDLKAPTFRHKAYDDYKANRKPMPDDLASEMPILQSVLEALDIKNLAMEGYEADDILGTIAKRGEEQGLDVLIVTGDKDALQLATDHVKVMINRKGITNFDIYDREAMIKEYGLTPLQFIDLKALMGDKSDNIPGVPGVGKVTGQKLIKEYGSLDNLKSNIEKISKPKLKQSLMDSAGDFDTNKKLVTIIKDVPIEFGIEDLKFDDIDKKKTKEWFVKLDFKRFQKILNLDSVGLEGVENPDKESSDLVPVDIEFVDSSEKIIESIDTYNIDTYNREKKDNKNDQREEFKVYIKTFTDNNHLKTPKIQGLGLYFDQRAYLLTDESEAISTMEYLQEENIRICGHNLKEDIYPFVFRGLDRLNLSFDTQIAEYVINPSKRDYKIETLSLGYLSVDKLTAKEDRKKSGRKKNTDTPSFTSREEIISWLGNYFVALEEIAKIQKEKLSDGDLSNLFEKIEMPLVNVLANMEAVGVSVDKAVLLEMGEELSEQIKDLEEEIYEEAGEEFNINSPAQLGIVLFENMGLPFAKKTKTGYSTSVDVLDKLKDSYPIVNLVLEYRAVTKLRSTYIDGLPKLIGKDGRIRPHFMQTVAATGRLSCTEPNLQNIPIRTEQGRMIRKAFVSESSKNEMNDDDSHDNNNKGKRKILIGADYSQIELRVLAHLSGDKALIDAFNHGEDIHKLTAMKVFGLSEDDITPLHRSRAKAINFGVIYGMSGFGLSENLNISRKEAERYIEDYFHKYKAVKDYMEGEIESVRKNGFSETLLGRRRYIGDINATNYMVRKAAERLAMNSPIQGSAADIIKVAMINVFNRIKSDLPEVNLILQIHDELILEGPENLADEMKKILVEEMENAVSLSVKLDANIEEGHSWYDLK